jgi:hypothetical protein
MARYEYGRPPSVKFPRFGNWQDELGLRPNTYSTAEEGWSIEWFAKEYRRKWTQTTK